MRPETTERSFRNLEVWQRAKELAVLVYRFTDTLPSDERFGLQQQLRRAAVGVVANIAEGHCRDHDRERIQFFAIARSSAGEVEAETEISLELAKGDAGLGSAVIQKADEVQRMLRRLQQFLARAVRARAQIPQSHNLKSHVS
ncbi:MAG: four helix bundle protein [bacterium]|nr:four helix bundle protein [bacterium]